MHAYVGASEWAVLTKKLIKKNGVGEGDTNLRATGAKNPPMTNDKLENIMKCPIS